MTRWPLTFGTLTLLLVLAHGSQARAGEEAGPDSLTRENLPALISRAASTDPLPLRTIIRLGGKLALRDILDPSVDANLTVAGLFFAQTGTLSEDEFRIHEAATPRVVWEMLSPTRIEAGERIPKYGHASLIFPEYITSTELTVEGDKASGTVAFRAPEAYEGTVHFRAAKKGDSGWQIVEFSFPKSGVAIRNKAGQWRLSVGDGLAPLSSLRGTAVRLPRVTLVRPTPSRGRLVISLTKDGEIRVPNRRQPLGLKGLVSYLADMTRDPSMREVDGTSRLHAILDIDETMPWAPVAWMMMACADPRVRIYKVSFGVRQMGSEAEGVLPATLPKDRGLAPGAATPREYERVQVNLVRAKEGGSTRIAALYEALMKIPAEQRENAKFEFKAPPPHGAGMSFSYVAQVLDVMMRAGARDLIFEGAPPPLGPGAHGAAGFTALVKRMQSARVEPAIRLNRVRLGRGSASARIPPPTAAERRHALIELRPSSVLVDEPVVEEEEVEEADITDRDVVAEEPVIKDEEIEDESFGESEGLTDAPFDSPTAGPVRKDPFGRTFDDSYRERSSVHDALQWLMAHQSPNGSWESEGFGRWCDGRPADVKRRTGGAGKALYDVGVTGLALCAFLSAGYTRRGRHPYRSAIGKGLRYLKNVQDPEGCFGTRTHQGFIYNHALASLAMVEAYGITGSPIFKGSAQRALDFIAVSRNPYFAWRYGIKPGDNDTSVTAWMTTVLKSASLINANERRRGRQAPLRIDETALDGVRNWLDKMTDPRTGRVGYITRGSGSARQREVVDRFPNDNVYAMTAAGIYMRILMGEHPAKSELLKKGAELVRTHPPLWKPNTGHMDMYYWYYGALAMHQLGGAYYKAWKPGIYEQIEKARRLDTDYCQYKGSWDPVGPWGSDGGRVYSTALMVLTIQTVHRYDRITPSR
ncbi:MAG: terpene cyclase/mutase family protein [bacterium]|nr:terpene cyclase/mutase family protein [bacterium]